MLTKGEVPRVWGIADHIRHLQKLLAHGVVGFYRSFEVTEVLGFPSATSDQPVNLFTLMVAEPTVAPEIAHPEFLKKKPMRIAGTDWKFGVARYRVPVEQAIKSLQEFEATADWRPSGNLVKTGKMAAVLPQFVPTDGVEPHPWNALLKNNYWEGSHVVELFDQTKSNLQFLLKEPSLLKDIAELIRPQAHMSIDGLSDRLGSIAIQLPVTVLSTAYNCWDSGGTFGIQPAWHPSVPPRPLRISCEVFEDSTVGAYDSQQVGTEMALFAVNALGDGTRYIIWDDSNKVILGASPKMLFFSPFGLNIHSSVLDDTLRTFYIPSISGELEEKHIPIQPNVPSSGVGSSPFKPHEPWRSRRIFSNTLHALKERKEFVQYGGQSGANRDQAFSDIHFLLRQHGNVGAWLWDPYLDADDLLHTLFYNGHAAADLRALSAGLSQTRVGWEGADFPKLSWKDAQNRRLESVKGNTYRLNLEFRVRTGHAGWDFHDRFLIFPSATGGAAAWSLGTSINSLGHKHHILQKVQDGELIRQAFLELWNALDGEEYLVWKSE